MASKGDASTSADITGLGTDTPHRQRPGKSGSAFQAQEYIDEYDQEATPPGESQGLTSSSSPGQSLHRNGTAPDPALANQRKKSDH